MTGKKNPGGLEIGKKRNASITEKPEKKQRTKGGTGGGFWPKQTLLTIRANAVVKKKDVQ